MLLGLEEILRRNLQGGLQVERPELGMVVAKKWELTQHLGSGGFGHVYEGWHLELDEPFALKFLDASRSDDETRARFLEEARVMARMTGQHLVRVLDYGQLPAGTPYFVMDRLWGRTLRQHLEHEPRIPVIEAIEIAEELLEGLAHVHDHGLVHGDIKPENVFLSDTGSRVRLLDFGLATTMGAAHGVGGTPPYMAPEILLHGQPATPRSDLYAVGVVLYEMLSGRLPRGHLRMGFERARRAWESGPAQGVRIHRGEISNALSLLVAEALSRNPDERPRTARGMLEDLRASSGRITLGTADTLPRMGSPSDVPQPVTDEASSVSRWPAATALPVGAGATMLVDASTPPVAPRIQRRGAWLAKGGIATALAFGTLAFQPLILGSHESYVGSVELPVLAVEPTTTEARHDPDSPPETDLEQRSTPTPDPASEIVASSTAQPRANRVSLRRRPSGPPSDAALEKLLMRRIESECSAEQPIVVSFVVDTDGTLLSLNTKPWGTAEDCVRALVKNLSFRKGAEARVLEFIVE